MRWLVPIAVLLVAAGAALPTELSHGPPIAAATASAPAPPHELTARRLRPRPGALAPGTRVDQADLFTDRVFTNARDGFALANEGNAQYPARTRDGGRVWRIDGPQVHIDAADGAEGVGYVGMLSARAYFAYGSSVVDVTTNGGRTWWETFLGELVSSTVPGPGSNGLLAYVQQGLDPSGRSNAALTWQYVSTDGGRRWHYSTALGGQ